MRLKDKWHLELKRVNNESEEQKNCGYKICDNEDYSESK